MQNKKLTPFLLLTWAPIQWLLLAEFWILSLVHKLMPEIYHINYIFSLSSCAFVIWLFTSPNPHHPETLETLTSYFKWSKDHILGDIIIGSFNSTAVAMIAGAIFQNEHMLRMDISICVAIVMAWLDVEAVDSRGKLID